MKFLTKFISIIFLIFFLCGCLTEKEIAIKRIVPTRTGAGIRLTCPASVESVFIRHGKEIVFQQKIGEKTASLLVDFNWKKGESYTFNIKTADETLSGKSSPFEKPFPFELEKDNLGKPAGEVEMAQINEWSKKLYEEVDISVQSKIGIAGFDQTVRVYNNRGKLVWKYKIPAGVAKCVKFSPAGGYPMAFT